ncbi:SAM-dependent methyltransferase [Actinoplanes sp. KI2]|uniref:SAM-dependent methyltransferase n=1 Tax=Actinoplanes sp. KI2 TaxID=2983315 RepID=UPI0021D5AA7C|nr:SAM-dependent methyltransferase [Actinoplanes sp. KI2]MCU7726505.1 SAM-dependent methyltransferase [Actinoplanes sp. KI2]
MTIGETGIDATVAHPARRYNYWLGGKDNFAADRASGDEIEKKFPGMRAGVRANRDVLGRMVQFLATDAGIRQFLDIGTGLPTADNTHEVAQRITPDSRVVYVDNDPMVMVHAQALLTSAPGGRTTYIEADLRDPATILASPELRETLDLGEPVALMLVAILHFIPGEGAAQPLVRKLLDALPSGSYLAATHFTTDYLPAEERERYAGMLAAGRSDVWPRDRNEFEALFEGLELAAPGVALATEWRPSGAASTDGVDASRISMLAAVGRKP